MGKKTKSKQRLDTFYHYAKQQGFRSRAAYKLIQLNRKYNFLTNSNTLIDLCAAPGGWMQVAAQFMPLNSTIIGVDLDPIKKVPGARSFIGDITTKVCYDRLRKQLQGRKCDVVLNDGAPNVGANWNKDAYSQSQLVLAALQLACSFLRQGGYFVTKVFRSTDFNSLIWVFNKFFQKVQVTKPKASRFSSAEIFVVCVGYLAPSFIDEKLFDAKYIFKDTQADHFRSQMQGQITSIDKLLQDRRKRGGYEDNVSRLYKEISLTQFIKADNPLLVFAIYNKITVSPQQRTKYLDLPYKKPFDTDELLQDIKVIGKRQIQGLLRWRGKIRQMMHKQQIQDKKNKLEKQSSQMQEQINQQVEEMDQQENDEEDEEFQQEEDQEQQQQNEENGSQQQENSQDQLERQMLKKQRKQLKVKRQQNERRKQDLIRAQAANQQHNEDLDFGEQGFADLLDSNQDIEDIQYDGYEQQQQQNTKKKPSYATYSKRQMQDNLQAMYQARQQKIQEKKQHQRQVRQQKKQRKQDRIKIKEHKLNPRKFIQERYAEEQQANKINKKNHKKENDQIEKFNTATFQNPLADFGEDLHISSQDDINYHQKQKINPDEEMDGEVSDDQAYIVPKAETDMEKRRKMMKKQQKKKAKKLKKDIQQGEDTGGKIQIVSHKKMEDYDIDSLAETLAIAKKMLRAGSRQEILEKSYRGFTFEDHQELPKWFADDEKRHNYKQDPITKEQFHREKQRLAAINAKMPKKIMEAKVRKKIRIQKKLKRTQKKAQVIMNQQGVTQYSKLRQVGKLYDKSKRQLKDKKKYIVGKRSKASGIKDTRNVKHVDNRMKKDKRSLKIKKTRHVHRNKKSRGKF